MSKVTFLRVKQPNTISDDIARYLKSGKKIKQLKYAGDARSCRKVVVNEKGFNV